MGTSEVLARDNRRAAINFCLRIASLASKFALSLYIAKYLSLEDLGIYGVVFGTAMISIVLFGGKVDFVLSRDIITLEADHVSASLRDQTAFYFASYALSVPLILSLLAFAPILEVDPLIVLAAWVICVAESYADLLWCNTNALGKPVASNIVFFIRSGLWALIVIVLGFAEPATRDVRVILAFWAAGAILAIMANLWLLNVGRWPSLRTVPFDLRRVKSALRQAFPIWIGALGLVGGSYLDRFLLAAFVPLKLVGVASFYMNFSSAVLTLVASSTLSIASPKLVRHIQSGDQRAYNQTLSETKKTVAVLTTVMVLGVALVIPLLATLVNRPEIYQERVALWLFMAATWVRCQAEVKYFELYAQRKDKPIWFGNLLFLVSSSLSMLALIPFWGLLGAGLAAAVASTALLVYRTYAVRRLSTEI